MKLTLRLAIIVLAAGDLCAPQASAQTSSASITGHVVDQSKGVCSSL
jgi:hypothetical protein